VELAIDPEAVDSVFDAYVAGAQRGDLQALGRLLDAFRPYLLAVANQSMPRALRGKHGGSDLVQETLARAHREFEGLRFDEAADVRAWLRTILRNILTDWVRRYRSTMKRSITRERSIHSQAGADTLALVDRGLTPSSNAMRREQAAAVDAAIERLPAHEREVILLRHREGLPFDEIGRRLDRSGEAARKVWARAILRIQRMLELHEP
jgi:RNA polymerase sigma-70 factor, ECF subfamily